MEPSHDDGFKWFGEGFDGFPKRLPDNTVQYDLFVIDDGTASATQRRARLNDLDKSIKQHVKKLLADYIWQHDAFELKLVSDSRPTKEDGHHADILPTYLHGRTEFGDSIADEWLIVYILLEISKLHSDVWIRVSDTDGEFLLIEAANALPKWLNPDVAENRVWLSNGHLKIIPLDDGMQANLKISAALAYIAEHEADMVISPFIEDEAFARLKAYPAAIEETMHHAVVSIPRNLAFVLHERPKNISPAIDAFYLRDAVSLRPLSTKDISTLRFAPEDFVDVSVKFTKVGYAQLQGQVFDAPPSWVGLAPRLKDEKVQTGMKLTCGFEMLLADPLQKDKRAVREIQLLLDELESGEAAVPDDKELSTWSQRQDDEKWLTIDYKDFERELSGQSKKGAPVREGSAQDNLRNMVKQFQDFIKDDAADSSDDGDSEISSTGEDKDGSFDDAEFEAAMQQMMGMSEQAKQESGLLDEARKLALDDGDLDPDEEDADTKEMVALFEEELRDAGALRRRAKRTPHEAMAAKAKPMFGPVLPPGFRQSAESVDDESADEEIGPGDEDILPGDVELSSDDEEYNDVDVNLARNLLQSFKGQAGASGPAGNMMRAFGINMPRDEDE